VLSPEVNKKGPHNNKPQRTLTSETVFFRCYFFSTVGFYKTLTEKDQDCEFSRLQASNIDFIKFWSYSYRLTFLEM